MNDAVLVIMAKLPAVDQTKSRLSPPLTPAEAVALYEALLRDTIGLAAQLGVQLAIAITPADATEYFRRISPSGTVLLPVVGVDIGDCLSQALGRLLADGYAKALALNSDGPTLPIAYLRQALAALENHEIDIVLGPSEDGGYYLIGLKEPHPGLFQGIAWSTDRVMAQTLIRAETMGLEVFQLPSWYDVDTAAELDRLQAELPTLPDGALPHTRRLLSESQLGEDASTSRDAGLGRHDPR
jgi:rSAM/selenodomain-associated transferase 1